MLCSKMNDLFLSRRHFLIYTSMSSALFLSDPIINTKLLRASSGQNYYQLNGEKFMVSFEKTLTAAMAYLTAKYDNATAREICKTARNEFKQLLPGLTDIGGDRHPGTKWMLLAGHWVAFMRPMREKGYSVESAARMLYDLYQEDLNMIPKKEMIARGQYMFTEKYITAMKNWSDRSKEQCIDWVADFIPGDGNSFDFGIDYHYCPCLAYFSSKDAKEIAPYFCLVDFPEHRLMGTGLMRTQTLAQGNDVCDFRYKKGRQVTQDWSTEVQKFNG